MLVPASILVVLMLGAIAVDSAIAYEARSSLQAAVSGAANDAVAASVSPDSLQKATDAAPDPQRASELVHQRLDGLSVSGLRASVRPADVEVVTDVQAKSVTVRAASDVPYIFAKAIPGAPDHVHVVAQSRAVLEFAAP